LNGNGADVEEILETLMVVIPDANLDPSGAPGKPA
jgi:hypothetical protein